MTGLRSGNERLRAGEGNGRAGKAVATSKRHRKRCLSPVRIQPELKQ